jgi:RNA polymerase sigma factor (sigma-70 family)
MGALPATRPSLLVRIQDPRDQEAWRQFVELYAVLIYGFLRKRGLQDADAADLMQEVLRFVVPAAGRPGYDPRRGAFRSWLFTITRNKLVNFLESQKTRVHVKGGPDAQRVFDQHAGPDEDAAAQWEHEYERRAFAWAAELVRDKFPAPTWQAFWLTAVDGRSAREVGQALSLSPGAVYLAKSQVLARLRQEIQHIEDGVGVSD